MQTPYYLSVADDTDEASRTELFEDVVRKFGIDTVTAALDPTILPKDERAINCMNYLGLNTREHMHRELDAWKLSGPMREMYADVKKYPHVVCDDFTGKRDIAMPSFDRVRDLMDKHFKRGAACISGSAALACRFPELGIEPNDIDIFVTGLDFSLVRGPYGPDKLAPVCNDLDDLLDTLRAEFGRYTFDDTYNSVKRGDFHVYSFGLVQIIVNTTGRNVVETFDIDAIGVCYWSGIAEPTVTDACFRAVRDRKCKCLEPMTYERYYKYSKFFEIEDPMLPREGQTLNITWFNAKEIFPRRFLDANDAISAKKLIFTECDQETVTYVLDRICSGTLKITCFVRCSDVSISHINTGSMYFIECNSIVLEDCPRMVGILNSSHLKINMRGYPSIWIKDSHNIMISSESRKRISAAGSQVYSSREMIFDESVHGSGIPNLSKFLSRRK